MLLVAAEPPTAALPTKRDKMPAFSVLPQGSELKGVMVPRYNRERELIGSLKAAKIRLVDEDEISAEKVIIESFNVDQTTRDRIDMETAIYDQERGLVSSHQPVTIQTERMTATGSGLYYYFPAEEDAPSPVAGRGFLLGPATTILRPATLPATSMHAPIHPLRATAMLSVALVSASLPTAARPYLTEDEKSAVHADAASRADRLATAAAETHVALDQDLADGAAASQAVATFLVQADLPPVQPAPVPEAKPLTIEPGPNDTVIDCDGGLYFDPEEGVLVYLKNVIVHDPRFDLTGTINELKVFFSKKPVKPDEKKSEADGDFSGFANNLGEVERIVATGAVVLDQKPAKAGEDAIKASGAVFSYNIKEDQIIISGGYPWFTRGKQTMRAKQPNLALKISPKKGTAVTDGGEWTTLLNLEPKKK